MPKRAFAGAAALMVSAAALAGCGERRAEDEARVGAPAEIVDPTPAFLSMSDRHAELALADDPEFATSLGVSETVGGAGYAARLGSYGFDGAERSRALNEQVLQDLRTFDRAALAPEAAVTYDVLDHAYELGARRNQFPFGGAARWGTISPYPVTQISGPHLSLPRLMLTQHPLDTRADAEAYLSRLAEFGRVFDETVELIGGDAALGVTPPVFAIDGALASIAAFVAPAPRANPLVSVYEAKLDVAVGLSLEDRAALVARAEQAVADVVYPAYARLAAALEERRAQSASVAAVGVSRLGDFGAGYYQLALASYGGAAMTAEEVHDLGLAEVARISAEMDAILKAQGLASGSVADRLDQLVEREGSFYPDTDEGRETLLADLSAEIVKIMARAPDWFGRIPEQPVEVRRIPIHEQGSSSGGYYTGPPLDGSRPGIFWINLQSTRDWPKYALKTLTYHEAAPGHHFQVATQRSIENMPIIRNMILYSEFAEGWALYAERVAAEMGMYADDPLGDLGRLQAELFRSVRLVVDSGLHHKGWSRERAIDYMTANTGRSPASIVREVERYAVWPGQACAYKLGMLTMLNLRAEAEAGLGDRFDIRAFHDEVLAAGSIPAPVLERRVRAWIEAQKAKTPV